MFKVKLRNNVRVFETDDSDFIIKAGEVKIVPDRMFRSFEIRRALFYGQLKLVEGHCLFSMKNARMYFSASHKDFCFCLEFAKFFKRDLDLDKMDVLAEKDVPEDIRNILKNNFLPEDVPDVKLEKVGVQDIAEPEKEKEEIEKEEVIEESEPEESKAEKEESQEEIGEKEKEVEEEKNPFDLDGDGDVDAEDRTIAAKLLASKEGRK